MEMVKFCRKKPVCTYHSNKLVCGGATAVRAAANKGWMIILTLIITSALWNIC